MRAFWAGALSLLAPGLGHVYAGAYQRGLIGFLVQTGLALAIVGTTWGTFPSQVAVALTAAIVAALISNWLFMSIDAARRAYRKPGLRSRWYRSTWIAAFACLASSAGIDELGLGWRSFAVPSDSNLPNARSGDVIEAAVWRTPDLPQRGAMVAFRLPRYRTTPYMKRVIGLPGDRVQMKRGALWLNGAAVPRSADRSVTQEVTAARVYFETPPGGRRYRILQRGADGPFDSTKEFVVPDGTFFALGDNRSNSLDSRSTDVVGFIPFHDLLALMGTVIWSSADLRRIGQPIE